MLAFNALPAALTSDMWTHVYVQQANSVFAGDTKPKVTDAKSSADGGGDAAASHSTRLSAITTCTHAISRKSIPRSSGARPIRRNRMESVRVTSTRPRRRLRARMPYEMAGAVTTRPWATRAGLEPAAPFHVDTSNTTLRPAKIRAPTFTASLTSRAASPISPKVRRDLLGLFPPPFAPSASYSIPDHGQRPHLTVIGFSSPFHRHSPRQGGPNSPPWPSCTMPHATPSSLPLCCP